MKRPSSRWLHSHQKICLNSDRLMPALSSRYCGIFLYASKASVHCASDSGGTLPVTGFHSTIDRPDSVSRVAPPTSTISAIRAAPEISHQRTARGGLVEAEFVVISGVKTKA